MYAGLQFLVSGFNVVKREMAKEWLRNTVLMIVFIQASFYLYGLILNISALLTAGILSLVNQDFFLLTADNLPNIGLEFVFTGLYVVFLVISVLFLTIRFLVVTFGIVFVPIGIFCYFIPPLRSYGKLILQLLGMLIFITIIDAIIILSCSQLLNTAIFQDFKILLMIVCLMIIDLVFIILSKHIIHKTSIDGSIGNISNIIKYVGVGL